MECKTKNELELHLSDIRKLATVKGLTAEEKDAAIRAERFAITILSEHDASGHGGKQYPLATRLLLKLTVGAPFKLVPRIPTFVPALPPAGFVFTNGPKPMLKL